MGLPRRSPLGSSVLGWRRSSDVRRKGERGGDLRSMLSVPLGRRKTCQKHAFVRSIMGPKADFPAGSRKFSFRTNTHQSSKTVRKVLAKAPSTLTHCGSGADEGACRRSCPKWIQMGRQDLLALFGHCFAIQTLRRFENSIEDGV